MILKEFSNKRIVTSIFFGALVAIEAFSLNLIANYTLRFEPFFSYIVQPVAITFIAFVLVDSIRHLNASRNKRAIIALLVVSASFALAVGYAMLKLYWAKVQLTNSIP